MGQQVRYGINRVFTMEIIVGIGERMLILMSLLMILELTLMLMLTLLMTLLMLIFSSFCPILPPFPLLLPLLNFLL